MVSAKSKASNKVIFVFLLVFAVAILYPLLFILNNSFKWKFFYQFRSVFPADR